ncbi:MAG: hypothetical protein JNK30_01140 [Phenylobacterium sp.]|uniref:hypothetical protein n=1 Tax=Phenylobacterium sp. TaxID=1871053 RepID=UPI001A487101|nr:hypothetical protein [Phenylobacterium sp.]MBL8769959.1 hypothetical protein [Phenylobacterium sp.]
MRTVALAFAAAALLATPAAAETAKLNVAGKTPEQVAKAVWDVAQKTCRDREVMITMIEAHRACVVSTYRTTLANSGNAQLAALADTLPSS